MDFFFFYKWINEPHNESFSVISRHCSFIFTCNSHDTFFFSHNIFPYHEFTCAASGWSDGWILSEPLNLSMRVKYHGYSFFCLSHINVLSCLTIFCTKSLSCFVKWGSAGVWTHRSSYLNSYIFLKALWATVALMQMDLTFKALAVHLFLSPLMT